MINKMNPIDAMALIGNQQPNAKTIEGKPMPQVSLIAVQSRCVKIGVSKPPPAIEIYLDKRSCNTLMLLCSAALLAACVEYKNKAKKPKKRKA